MPAMIDPRSFDTLMRGLFPRTPEEMPDWARQARAARAELERTGRRVRVEPHLDNTGLPCREVGPASLVDDLFGHDCCSICGEHGTRLQRIHRGDLPRVLHGADWRNYAPGHYAPIWEAWCIMWGDIADLRERAFRADEVLFGGRR